MQILIIGAGVIGSIIAARLAASGHQVSVLEKGARLEQLTDSVITIRDGITRQVITAPVNVISDFNILPNYYDYVLVPVQASQIGDILSKMADNQGINNVVIMVNSLQPAQAYTILKQKMLLGFPGMGGGFEGKEVVYRLANPYLQKTSLGEINGTVTPRVRTLVKAFAKAGMPAASETNMIAWQQTHISWVIPLAAALYSAGINNYELARNPELIKQTILATREVMQAIELTGTPITPGKFKWIKRLPIKLQIPFWQKALTDPSIEYLAVRHCRAAVGEIRMLADELADFVGQAGAKADHFRDLRLSIPFTNK
ncbi:MAG: ketopantoate reductase family protein [Methylocystaceae bacterium]